MTSSGRVYYNQQSIIEDFSPNQISVAFHDEILPKKFLLRNGDRFPSIQELISPTKTFQTNRKLVPAEWDQKTREKQINRKPVTAEWTQKHTARLCLIELKKISGSTGYSFLFLLSGY